jgi:intracellular septation protein
MGPAMKQALWHLLNDFLSAILFLIVYAISGSVRVAAAVAVGVGVAHLAWLKFSARQIEPMQWTSLGLVVVLGGATILTQNPRFVMAKPSVIHFAVAAAMLRRGWMIRYITADGAAQRVGGYDGSRRLCLGGADGGARSHQFDYRAVL